MKKSFGLFAFFAAVFGAVSFFAVLVFDFILLRLITNSSDIIYVPEPWILSDYSKNGLFASVISAGKDLNKPFIGYVFDIFSQIS